MAFDTKPNLNDNKFEQFAGETLSLSGCTDIYGEMEIRSGGSFLLADGTQGLNKIMTSNAAGKGTWTAISNIAVITGSSNGLTTIGQEIKLGGTACEDIDLILDGNEYCIRNASPSMLFRIEPATSQINFITPETSTVFLSGKTCLQAGDLSPNKAAFLLDGDNANIDLCSTGTMLVCANTLLNIRSDATIFTDANNDGGVKYAADYSGSYTARSLVDCAFVTSCAGSSGIQTADNGLTKLGTNVVLGGTLTGTTTIDGDNNSLCLKGLDAFQVTGATGFMCFSSSATIRSNGFSVFSGIYQTISIDSSCRRFVDSENYEGFVYGGDYSTVGAVNPRWIPDVDWVTGNTGVGNINWEGSTAKGIGTYVDADSICSEPNLTFTGALLSITGGLKITKPTTQSTETNILYIADDGTVASGATSGGGISWTGSSANGIGTYVDGNTICSEPNFTFDGSVVCLCSGIPIHIHESICGLTSFGLVGVAGAGGAAGVDVSIRGGSAVTGSGGNAYISAGNSTSGIDGNIYFQTGTGPYNKFGATNTILYMGTGGVITTGAVPSGTITGGTNGLSTCGENVVLGGALTGDTQISVGSGCALNICATGGADLLFNVSNTSIYACYASAAGIGSRFCIDASSNVKLSYESSSLETGLFIDGLSCTELKRDNGASDCHYVGIDDTGLKLYSSDNIYMNGLPTQSTETNILYIASDGTVASGATSGGGGISWSGSTVNGIGTYIDSDTIYSQPNFKVGFCCVGLYQCCNYLAFETTSSLGTCNVICGNATAYPSPFHIIGANSSGATAGSSVGLYAGCNSSTGCGGSIYLRGGNTAGTCAAGSVYIQPGISTSGTDGVVCICGNTHVQDKIIFDTDSTAKYICQPATGTPSSMYINAGVSTDGTTGGRLYLKAGSNSSTSGAGGILYLCSGIGSTTCGAGGNMYICAGRGNGGSTGGNMCICAGRGGTTSGTGGDVSIVGGNTAGGDSGGDIFLRPGCSSSGTDGKVVAYWCASIKMCTCSGGICVCQTVGQSSDIRIKKNVVPVSNALSMINCLCGVCFEYCENNKQSMGLIAQDVKKVLPRLVDQGDVNENDLEKYGIEDGTYGLNYAGFTPVLIEAIKEQQKQINELIEEVNILKNI